MLQRSLIFVGILTAAVVALAIVLLTGRSGGVAPGSSLVGRSVYGATAVEITPSASGGETHRFVRVDDAWTVDSDGWPANDAAVRAMLRLLSEVAVSGNNARPTDGESRVLIEFEGGDRAEFWIEPSSRAVGGGAVIRDARGAFGRAPVDLARAIESATVDAWRSPAAMPRVEIEASRVRLEYVDAPTISLARVDGRWYLRDSVRARADDRAVAALLGDLIDLRAVRFSAEPGDQVGRGLSSVIVEKDRRALDASGSASTSTETSVLRVLGPSRDDPNLMVVESDGVRLALRRERLDALVIDPEVLVARSAMHAAPSDVGMLAFRGGGGEFAFRRKVLEWDALGADVSRLLDPSVESDGVERTLSFLANAQADRVELDGSNAIEPTRFLQVFGLGDLPIATFGVLRDDAGGVTIISEREPSVRRSYSAAQIPPLLRAWLEME